MKYKFKFKTLILIIVALIILFATFLHGSIADISIFHGMILHPVFVLIGLSLFAFVKPLRNSD